ncbi:MAG: 30S ribosomal protein S6e [Nanoarchaeota archaeon]|nr:30S ribosomal protein S6e [Nanoarchaeota archaeon]
MSFKVNISTKDGKSHQIELKGNEAEALMRKNIGDKISGDSIGLESYELQITGGSDKSGFPMRKGIQTPRKRVMIKGGVGFSGKKRNKTKQKGLLRRRTVAGEKVFVKTTQINMKVLKAGAKPLGAPAEEAPAENKE